MKLIRLLAAVALSVTLPPTTAGAETRIGTDFTEKLVGQEGDSVLYGLAGHDTLVGDPQAGMGLSISLESILERIQDQLPGTSEYTLSPDGMKLAFVSDCNACLIPGITGKQVYLKNLNTNTITLVSGIFNGNTLEAGNAFSENPTFSPDGTKLAFSTASTNLAGATGGFRQILVKDLNAADGPGAFSLVSRRRTDGGPGTGGDSYLPIFHPSGDKVAFTSEATDLVPFDGNGLPDIFIVTAGSFGETARISTTVLGSDANKAAGTPTFSPNGQSVVYIEGNKPGNIGGNIGRVMLRNLLPVSPDGGLLSERVSLLKTVSGADALGISPVFSPDGREILVSSFSTELGIAKNPDIFDLFILTLEAGSQSALPPGSIRLISTNNIDGTGMSDGGSYRGQFSNDGAHVVFETQSSNLVTGSILGVYQTVVRDLSSGEILLLSRQPLSPLTAGDKNSTRAMFHPNGAAVFFLSTAANLPTDGFDANGKSDLFLATLAPPVPGNDVLIGGSGNDILNGGPGVDTAVYPGPRHRYTVVADNGFGHPGVTDLVTGENGQGSDTLIDMEMLQFDDMTVPLDKPGPGNAAPVGNGLAFKVGKGATAGPFKIGSDPNGDAVTYSKSNPANGALSIDVAAGTFTYTHNGSATATDTFSIFIDDPYGATGSADFTVSIGSLTGTSGDDQIFGGGADEILLGGAGNDVLSGGGGNDVLDGGVGADTMIGGPGDDTFIVDNVGDIVVEAVNEGIDTVKSSIAFTLPANVENLILTGAAPIAGTGNALDNVITGNPAANVISGGAGDDTIDGGGGADVLDGGPGSDTLSFASSRSGVTATLSKGPSGLKAKNFENLLGSKKNDVLTGNNKANVITGGRGKDTLKGGKGADRFVYTSIADSTRKKPDRILDFSVKQGDIIDLSAIDAKPKTKARNRFKYIGARAFTKRAGQLRFAKGYLEADTTGNGKANFRIKLDGVKRLPASSIIR